MRMQCKTDICKTPHRAPSAQTQDCGIQSVQRRLTTFITFDSLAAACTRGGGICGPGQHFYFPFLHYTLLQHFAQRSELCFINDGLRAAAECTLAQAILATFLPGVTLQTQNLFRLSEFLSHILGDFAREHIFSCQELPRPL